MLLRSDWSIFVLSHVQILAKIAVKTNSEILVEVLKLLISSFENKNSRVSMYFQTLVE
jgi:hypothetical protein